MSLTGKSVLLIGRPGAGTNLPLEKTLNVNHLIVHQNVLTCQLKGTSMKLASWTMFNFRGCPGCQ